MKHLALALTILLPCTSIGKTFELRDGDNVVFLGDSFIEREQYAGWIELAATTQFPERNVTFRNLGWSADTPAGDSRNGLSLVQAGREPTGEGWNQLLKQLSEYKPDVIVLGYGTAASLPGGSPPDEFRTNLTRLLDEAPKATGKETRFLILGTTPRADGNRPAIEAILSETAAKRNLPFVGMEDLANDPSHFQNPIHLTSDGYKAAARIIEKSLSWQEKPWDKGEQAEILRQHILKKNEWFFHRSRPANMAYIFGFRKREQGRNAGEIPQFDALIAEEDAAIAKMRDLSNGVIVPMQEPRTESKFAKKTIQEHPKFTVADGFEVTLWAENPLFHKPTQMNFDPQGRLWVTSCLSYPQIEVGQTPDDKVIILEDTTGDGKADKSTVFADGMLMPTGLLPADGGVYVAQSTDLLHFEDTDGDGKADVKTRELSGFGTEDTHHNLHTLRRGPDGRIWMNQSIYTRSDVETPHGIVRLKSGGIFRFDPRKMELKPTYFGFWNAWGHQFDKYGQSFLTDGAGGTGINWGMPGATYEAFAGAKKALGGVSPGGHPKFCGLEIIESAHFPADWQGNMITCDFRAHRVVRFSITDEGAGYVTQRLGDLLHTDSANFRPIDVKIGPDGALYIADWANPIINHGEVDFRDPRRDREHGRIWRVAKKDSPLLTKRDFTKLPGTELVAALGSANRYDRDQATAALYESASPGLEAALESASKTDGVAALNASRILASRFGKSSDAIPAGIAFSLASETPEIRAAAVRLLVDPNHRIKPEALSAAFRKSIADPSPRVRLETIRALAGSLVPNPLDIALDALKQPRDRFIDYALWLGVQSHGEEWLVYAHTQSGTVDAEKNQFVLANLPPEKSNNALARAFPETLPKDGSGPWLQLGIKNGDAAIITKIFDQAVTGGFDETTTTAAFKGIVTAISERQVKPKSDVSKLAPFVTRADPAAIELAGALADGRLLPSLISTISTGNKLPDATVGKIIAALGNFPSPPARDILTKLAADANPSARSLAALALTRHHREASLPLITSIAATLSDPQASRDFWQKALTASGLSKQLAETLKAKPLPPEIAALTLQHIPEIAEHDALLALLRTQAGASASQTHDIPAMAKSAAEKGDARRGELIYRRPALACTACHAIGGAGGKVGPDMTSIGASAPMDYLIESVVNPGAKIKEGYHSVIIQTKDGKSITGQLIRSSGGSSVIRDGSGAEITLADAMIASKTDAGSLMPGNLIGSLTPQETDDLFKFLSSLGKPGEFSASDSKAPKVYAILSATPENTNAATQGDPKLPWMPINATVNGSLLAQDLASTKNPLIATKIQLTEPNALTITFPENFKATGFWINGKPAESGPQLSPAGIHTLVIRSKNFPDRFRIQSASGTFLPEW
ncbi:c-type cytochrome [Akkermansiaceae bacterium]|nr:c-type cytochrome [Akkermansiaceae bacterium]